MGPLNFDAVWKQAGYANPANGQSTVANFVYDGANWVQVSGWTAAIPT